MFLFFYNFEIYAFQPTAKNSFHKITQLHCTNNPYLPYNCEATYHLTRSKIVQDLAVSSTDRSRYSGVMSSKDIEASQKKIGAYHR